MDKEALQELRAGGCFMAPPASTLLQLFVPGSQRDFCVSFEASSAHKAIAVLLHGAAVPVVPLYKFRPFV